MIPPRLVYDKTLKALAPASWVRERERREQARLDIDAIKPGISLPDDPSCGIVVGTYWHVPLVELQIRSITYACGPVPIMISDDCSPGREEMRAITARYPHVCFRSNSTRQGHVWGDLDAYLAGLEWARDRGFKVMAKISNRWLCVNARWLQEGAKGLLASGRPLGTVEHRGCSQHVPIRTEACLLNVEQWYSLGMVERLIKEPRGGAESLERKLDRVYRGCTTSKKFRWPAIADADRDRRSTGILWHDSSPECDYRTLGGFFGVDLGPDFNVGSSAQIPGYHI